MNKQRFPGKIFDCMIVVFFIILIVVMVFPLYNVLTTSLITAGEFYAHPLILWPQNITLDAYKYIFSSEEILQATMVTIFITVAGTVLSMLFTLMLAYGLSKRFLPGKKLFITLIILTMFFDSGLIPFYLLVRDLKLINNIMVNIWPALISAWNFIIIKSFFMQLPQSLEESAIIDGAGYMSVFIRIVLPISQPVIATFALFYGVEYWNTWWNSLLFVTNNDLHPLQLLLRRMVIDNEKIWGMQASYRTMTGSAITIYDEGIKMATCIVAVVPIICVYPFLQKYFVKGVMLGAIKG